MKNYPKHIKKLILQFSMEAHERELHRELVKLDQHFEQWRAGKIGSGELSVRVHEYDRGPSKELFGRYNSGYPELNVAAAIATGLIKPEEVPPELLEAVEPLITSFGRDIGPRTEEA